MIENVEEYITIISEKLVTPDFVTFSVREKKMLPVEDYRIKFCEVAAFRRNRENYRIDEYYSKKKNSEIKSDLILKKEDFLSDENFAGRSKTFRESCLNESSISSFDSQSMQLKEEFKFRGENKRIKNILSMNNIEEENVKSEVNTYFQMPKQDKNNLGCLNNNKLFEEIKNEIKNSENLNSSQDDEDEEASKTIISSSFDIADTQSTTESTSFSLDFSSQNLEKNSTKNYFNRRKPDKSKFAFNSTSGSKEKNLNEHIIVELEKILEYHANENNVFESLAYRKAISQLKSAKEKITSCEQLKNYKFFGKSIGNKIKEILLTGRLKKTEYLNNDDKNKTIKLFTSVWGIGMAQANKLFKKGLRTIEELRKHEHLLNSSQKIGLKHFDDLILRISRKEIEEIFDLIKEQLFKILQEDLLIVEVCGSYRRGKETCGDIDVLITRRDDGEVNGILPSLVEKLLQASIITEVLQIGGYNSRSQFMGICKMNDNPNRRIDIKVYKKVHFASALLYFTGSAYFNRSMRLFASKLGYSLSDLSLKHIEGTIIKCETEKDIFKALDLDYIQPDRRDI